MANLFPTQLNNFVTGASSGLLGDVGHAASHNALEAKVGVDGSAVTTSHDFKLSGVTTGDKAVSLTGTEVLTNKTLTAPILTAPVISTISNTGTLTLPTSTDTLVGKATTDILTNKTLTSPVINTGVSGTAISTSTSLTENSDTILASQKAVKAYVDAAVANKVLYRAFTWYLDGTSVVADEVGAKYICPKAMTVKAIKHKTVSGTATIRLQKGTTDIDASISVTSSVATETTITSASLAADDVITLDITAASSCVGLTVCMECEQ